MGRLDPYLAESIFDRRYLQDLISIYEAVIFSFRATKAIYFIQLPNRIFIESQYIF